MMAKNSYHLSNAVMAARSAASCYKAADGDLQRTAALLEGQQDGTQCVVYYDHQWQQVEQPVQKGFLLQLAEPEQSGEAVITVQEQKNEAVIFQLQVKAGGGGSHES